MASRLNKVLGLILALAIAQIVLPGCGDHRASLKTKPGKYAGNHKKKRRTFSGKLKPGEFIWPVAGVINSPYGQRWGRPHDGIDIGGESGDPVVASASGEVVFSGKLGGYGNLIVIKHDNGLFTAYGHNKKNLVQEGDRVRQGKRIARLGRTGRATGDHLHFEIRDKEGTFDPQSILPSNKYARGRDEEKGPAKRAVALAPPEEKKEISVAERELDRLEPLPSEKPPAPAEVTMAPAEAGPTQAAAPAEPEVPEDKMMELLSDI